MRRTLLGCALLALLLATACAPATPRTGRRAPRPAEESATTQTQEIEPTRLTWSWVGSAAHNQNSYDMQQLLIGTRRTGRGGSPCARCHAGDVGEGFYWPRWSGPPLDHKWSTGCQTCHGVLRW